MVYRLVSLGVVCVAGLMVVVPGCGTSRSSNRPATVPVTVTVTAKGSPVDGARVTLMPQVQGPGQGTAAFGTTDAQGKAAQFTTFEANDGVIPGNYQVTIVKTQTSGGPKPSTGPDDYDPNPKELIHKDLLNKKYKDPAKSGLKAEVKASGDNSFTFDLQD